jgi:hypothetical protein
MSLFPRLILDGVFPVGRTVSGVKSAAAWLMGSAFEFCWRHGCLSLALVVCCVGSSPWDGLVTRSKESYRLCASNCVWSRNLKTRRTRLELGCCTTDKKKPQWVLIPVAHRLRHPREMTAVYPIHTYVCRRYAKVEPTSMTIYFLLFLSQVTKVGVSKASVFLTSCYLNHHINFDFVTVDEYLWFHVSQASTTLSLFLQASSVYFWYGLKPLKLRI